MTDPATPVCPPEKCPLCGYPKVERNEYDGVRDFNCGSAFSLARQEVTIQTGECRTAQMNRELSTLTQRLSRAEDALSAALENKWAEDDEPMPEDKAIDAEHPMTGTDPDRFRRYAEALRMVGKKRSKYALVDLVHWLLTRAERAELAREALNPTPDK